MKSPRLAILVCLTGFYLLVGSREPPWGDARIMAEVTESIVTRHQVRVRRAWPPMSHAGPDGKIYSQYALGPSLVSLPSRLVRDHLADPGTPSAPMAKIVTGHMGQAVMGALTCMLFFGVCRRLGATPRAASLGALTLGLATMVLVYARSPFSEIVQTACVLGYVGALLAVVEEPTRNRALAVGAWAAALLNAKAVFALSILGGAIFLVVTWRRDRKQLGRMLGWAAAAGAPGVLVFLLYNRARWGGLFETGYGETLGLMREDPVDGLWGMLLSPGKSLFLYSPPLVVGALALGKFARAHRGPALLLALVGLPPLLFYSRFLSWAGDWCWGPRYLTYLVPLLLIPAVITAGPAMVRTRLGLGAAALVIGLGLLVQVLGAAFYWDSWIRIAMSVQNTWLGKPNRNGAALPQNELGQCDSCFEDMHGPQWLPPLSPIAGHWWLLTTRNDSWIEAREHAPWRRYTTLSMGYLEQPVRAVKLDWWVFLWDGDDTPASTRRLGWSLLVGFAAMTVGGGVWWWRRVRAATA